MWDKHIHYIHIEKAEFNARVGRVVREDLLSSVNIEVNNKAFLDELGNIIQKGYDYCNMWLSGLLSDYVKRRSEENDDSPYELEFYTSWLNNTIFILNGEYPAIKEWCEDYKKWIIQYYNDEARDGKFGATIPSSLKSKRTPDFRNIIQFQDKDKLLKRIHELIDGKSGAEVGAVLLNAWYINPYLTRRPTQAEFESEFELIGSWSAISNYLSENNQNAIDLANKIVIFQ